MDGKQAMQKESLGVMALVILVLGPWFFMSLH